MRWSSRRHARLTPFVNARLLSTALLALALFALTLAASLAPGCAGPKSIGSAVTPAGETGPTGTHVPAPGPTGPSAEVDPETKAKVKDLIKKLGDEDAGDRY